MGNLYLPKDTFEAKPNRIDNFALRLNKYPPTYKKYDKKMQREITEFALTYHEKKNIHREVKLDFQNSQKQILAFSDKYLSSLQQLPGQNLEISAFKPDWRLVVGLGSASVYETSITLHHIYGFPYIPGQAVKGVTRNYVICESFEKDEEKAEKDEEFKKIFGSQEQKGKVIFFDAYPQTELKLDFDIMNVHYPDYYSGKSEPTDEQNPNPITFLTVKDTTFFFPIGFPKAHPKESFTINGKTISELIKTALEEKGIGAKTSVGYGYLDHDIQSEEKLEYKLIEYQKQKLKKEKELEKQKKFDEMSELDKQLYVFSKEQDKEKKRGLSMDIFNQIEHYSNEEKRKIASLLKDVWVELGLWKKQKKKQKDRVKQVKQILGE